MSALFPLALAAFSSYFVYQFTTNFQPSAKKIVTDLNALKQEVQEWVSTLVPWSHSNMELLSYEQANNTIKKGLSKTAKGTFNTVYHEPLFTYSYKQYVSSGNNALLYARTSKNEFAFRIQKKEVAISIDNEYAGVLKEGGLFYGGPKQTLLARINQNEELKLKPIIIGDKEVASIVNPAKAAVPNPRALKFITPMEAEEEKIFLALAILEIVTDSFDRK